MRRLKIVQVILAAVIMTVLSNFNVVNAGLMTFDLRYSGASYGNTAIAIGKITFDTSTINNPGFSNSYSGTWPGIVGFTLTVSGASTGNGTFEFAEFEEFALGTNGGTLDFTQELVGQATNNLPWGTDDPTYQNQGLAGNFVIYAPPTSDAPINNWDFQIQTSHQTGDILVLESFAPSVPEPSSLLLLGVGGVAFSTIGARRKEFWIGKN